MSSSMTLKRLQREYKEMQKSNNDMCKASPTNETDLYHWTAVIFGPKETPFENGIFKLNISFPSNYPISPPDVRFETKMIHPNIYDSGKICLDILQDRWSAILTIQNVLISICSLLTDPNENSPANSSAAELYKRNKNAYHDKVREHVKLYASSH
jgi:ubiquitin-protein ligase